MADETISENADQQDESQPPASMPVREILAVAAEMLDGTKYDRCYADLVLRVISSLHFAHELDNHQRGRLYQVVQAKFDELDKAMLEVTFQAGLRNSREGGGEFAAETWWVIEYDFATDQPMVMQHQVMDEFVKGYFAAGLPRDAALFSSGLPDSEMKMRIYLSPASTILAGSVIQRYDAQPCSKPPVDSTLLVGDNSVVSLLK